MSIALLPQVLLRILTDPIYTAKGSALTWIQLDTDLKIIADACRELAAIGDTSGFEPYNNATTYSDDDPDYVSYNGNIYEYINPIPQSGITPGTDPLTWQIASQGQFAHIQNTDQYLDFGGANQVSAAAIKAFIEAVYPYLMQGTNTLTEDLYLFSNGNVISIGDIASGLLQIDNASNLATLTNSTDNGVSIGATGITLINATNPVATIDATGFKTPQDVEVTDITKGIILPDANGSGDRYRVTILDGSLNFELLP